MKPRKIDFLTFDKYQVSKVKLRDGNDENLTKTDATFQDKSTKFQKLHGMCQNQRSEHSESFVISNNVH